MGSVHSMPSPPTSDLASEDVALPSLLQKTGVSSFAKGPSKTCSADFTEPDAVDSIDKEIRKLRKALREIDLLEERQRNGATLEGSQAQKLNKRAHLEAKLASFTAW